VPQYGISPAGFSIKPLTQILADYQASWLANVDATADLSPTTPEGQILGIIANNDAELWELAQAGWNAFNRQAVEGAGLDALGALTGTPREGASYTQVVGSLTLAAGTYAAGALVASVAGNASLTFANVLAVTSTGGVNTVLMQAQTVGPTPSINPGTLTVISTPVMGWTAVTNAVAQSQLGAVAQSDTSYVVLQIEELAGEGASNASATQAALVALGASLVPPVNVTAEVFENTSNAPIVLGSLTLPANTFAPIVYEPTGALAALPALIAQTIYNNKPAGIASYGTTTGTVVDPVLGNILVQYTIPTAVPIFVTATVVLRPGFALPGVGGITAAIQAALVAAAIAPTPEGGVPPAGQLTPGSPVIGSQLEAVIMSVPGILDMSGLLFGTTATPATSTPIAISPTNVATIAASTAATNILVVQSSGPL
jgi:hypothetical protein